MQGLRHLSTTLVNNWGGENGCPRRAWRSYLMRLERGDDNEGTDATRFGTVVHAVQEQIHNELMVGDPVELTDDYIMSIFDRQWQEGTCYSFEIYAFGKAAIADFVRRGIVNRMGQTIATELMFVYEVETGVTTVPFDAAHRARIIDDIIARGNTPCSSEIDRVDAYKDDKGLHIVVYDYKTNILPFTRDEIENSKQLGLYALVAKSIWPDAVDVECVYDMLRWGRFPVTFPDLWLEDLRGYFRNLWQQIYLAEKAEERTNKYCRWCEIRQNCKAYQAMLESVEPPILTDTTDNEEDIAAMFERYEHLGDVVKAAQERQAEIRKAIGAKLTQDNFGEPLQIGKHEYYLQQNPRYELDKRGVLNTLTEAKALSLLPDIISVSKTAVERGLRVRPELRDKLLTDHMKKNFVTPTLKRRRVDGGTLNAEESSE